MIPTFDDVIKVSKIHPSKVKNIYVFGSQVYGTINKDSDWDFIMIANTPNTNQEIRSGNFNIHIMTEDQFYHNLKNHHSSTIECFFTPQKFRILETIKIDWEPNITSLRHSFSHISSNSWVKSKKKILQDEYYIGIKSLFHSLRIPMFGTQIATHGKIYDFSKANYIYYKLISKRWTWDEIDYEFRDLKNTIISNFRSVTTK